MALKLRYGHFRVFEFWCFFYLDFEDSGRAEPHPRRPVSASKVVCEVLYMYLYHVCYQLD